MGGFYQISGVARCKDSPEFREVLEHVEDALSEGFEFLVDDPDSDGIVAVTISGGDDMSYGWMREIDDRICDLSPHVVEPVHFAAVADEECTLYVGDPALEDVAYSAYRREKLQNAFNNAHEFMLPADVKKLIAHIRRAEKQKTPEL